jgi:mannose-6-phosphate isomerase
MFFLETGTVRYMERVILPKFSKLLTHRLYDFDRVDAQGNTRELHVDLALEAINYNRVDTE